MLGSNFALLMKSPGDDGQQLLTTGSSYIYRWLQWAWHSFVGLGKYIRIISTPALN